jgi:putative endonuclease
MDRKLRGGAGEAFALKWLKKKGYTPVGMGYRSRFGEIDLIVKNREYIVFVEVKLRKDSRFAEAREFVTAAKQERIQLTAQQYLSEHETGLQPRFDVMEIYAPEGAREKDYIVNHIENAF